MLTARQTFTGPTLTDVLAHIVARDPDWNALPESAAAIRSLLRRCLQKDRAERMRHITDARLEINDLLTQGSSALQPASIASPTKRRSWAAWSLAALAVAVAATVCAVHWTEPVPPETHLQIVTPSTAGLVSMAVSPDGRKLVFVASSQGRPQLFLRTLGSESAQALQGTDRAVLETNNNMLSPPTASASSSTSQAKAPAPLPSPSS